MKMNNHARNKQVVRESRYIFNEDTGEVETIQVPKMQDRIVTKYTLKEGYELDDKIGKVYKIGKNGKRGKTVYKSSDAMKTMKRTIRDVVYEDVA